MDLEGNEKNFPDKTLFFLEAQFKIDADFIEKSNRDGADIIGLDRVESKELPFQFQVWGKEQDFRKNLNELFFWFRKTKYVIDTVNKIRAKVNISEQSLKYIMGGFNRFSDTTVNFKMLSPYWEDSEETVESLSSISTGQIVIENDGYAPTPPIFEIAALEPTSKFSIIIQETIEGIAIKDLQFGNNGLDNYYIDCDEGLAELDNNTDRSEFIREGTGFFNLIVGTNTLLISSNGEIDVTVRYRRRWWL
jgi:hypothetical protein